MANSAGAGAGPCTTVLSASVMAEPLNSVEFGPAPAPPGFVIDADMQVDIDMELNLYQANLEQHNQTLNLEHTTNNLHMHVGVDPGVALALQREAEEARSRTAAVTAAAEQHVSGVVQHDRGPNHRVHVFPAQR